MNERTLKIVTIISVLVIFAVSIGLVAAGQRMIGPTGLLFMLLGLAGLIFLLYRYNRKFR